MSKQSPPDQNQREARGLASIAQAIREYTSAYRQHTNKPFEEPKKNPWLTPAFQVISILVASAALTMNILLLRSNQTQFQSSERAWINYSDTDKGLRVIDESGKVIGYTFIVGWKNSGKTPAVAARSYAGVHFSETKKSKGYSFPRNSVEERPFAIGPQDMAYAPVPLPTNDMSRIGRGRYGYIWGWAEYRDVFPDTALHVTEFCQEIILVRARPLNQIGPNPTITDPLPSGEIVTADCGWHSCYDRACPDYDEHATRKND